MDDVLRALGQLGKLMICSLVGHFIPDDVLIAGPGEGDPITGDGAVGSGGCLPGNRSRCFAGNDSNR